METLRHGSKGAEKTALEESIFEIYHMHCLGAVKNPKI